MNPAQVENFRRFFVLTLFVGIALLFGVMLWPFLKPLFLAAILSGLLYPVFRTFRRVFRGNQQLASLTTIITMIVLVVGPMSAFIGVVAKQAIDVSNRGIPWFRERIESGALSEYMNARFNQLPAFVRDNLPEQGEILDTLGGALRTIGNFLLSSASQITTGAAGFLLALFVMFYAMFFFLIDGPKILDRVLHLMPLGLSEKEKMLDRFLSVTRATIKGTFVIALVQGLLGGVGFAVAGIGSAAFWGTIMAVLSIIPVVGTPIVWIPGAIVLMVNGQIWSGILLLLWGAVVVSSVDNVLRPILIGADTKMPDLLVLLGTLGGLSVFGPLGLLVGPIICGLFLTGIDIYSASYRSALYKNGPGARPDSLPDPPPNESGESGPGKEGDGQSRGGGADSGGAPARA